MKGSPYKRTRLLTYVQPVGYVLRVQRDSETGEVTRRDMYHEERALLKRNMSLFRGEKCKEKALRVGWKVKVHRDKSAGSCLPDLAFVCDMLLPSSSLRVAKSRRATAFLAGLPFLFLTGRHRVRVLGPLHGQTVVPAILCAVHISFCFSLVCISRPLPLIFPTFSFTHSDWKPLLFSLFLSSPFATYISLSLD